MVSEASQGNLLKRLPVKPWSSVARRHFEVGDNGISLGGRQIRWATWVGDRVIGWAIIRWATRILGGRRAILGGRRSELHTPPSAFQSYKQKPHADSNIYKSQLATHHHRVSYQLSWYDKPPQYTLLPTFKEHPQQHPAPVVLAYSQGVRSFLS